MIRAVVFDVGETLRDDSSFWRGWAEWLGVPAHTLSALVGAVTALGKDSADALRLIRPGLDVATERQAREAAGRGERITEDDLYPDVRPALAELQRRGVWVGVAGNQTAQAADELRALQLPADAIATSGEWGVAKPDLAFFTRLIHWTGFQPDEIAYVGDHRDNDATPAKAAGLHSALIRRGPWGYLWADDPKVRHSTDWLIARLADLPDLMSLPRDAPS
jgi:FMN phosphatase YigB (HAD superfamily)